MTSYPSALSPEEAAIKFSQRQYQRGYKLRGLYCYEDAQGCPLFWSLHLKHRESGKKWIRPMCVEDSHFVLRLPSGRKKKVLFNLPAISNSQAPVVVVEGEACADHLIRAGILATTSGSASSADSADWSPLAGRQVVVWPDNDVPGAKHAQQVAKILQGLKCSVSVVDAAKLGIAEKGDCIDFYFQGGKPSLQEILALPRMDTHSDSRYVDETSELANAYRLSDILLGQAAHCDQLGWLVNDSGLWACDEAGAVTRATKLSKIITVESRALMDRAMRAENEPEAQGLRKRGAGLAHWANRSESRRVIDNSLALAKGLLSIAIDDLDADPYALNCTNGAIDLETGVVREAKPEDYFTRRTAAPIRQDAQAPNWEQFLKTILPDKEVREFMQSVVGMSLIGQQVEHVLIALFGTGCNGKSTFVNAIMSVLGSYAIQAPRGLIESHRSERHTTDLTDLRSARFVVVAEFAEDGRLDENCVKSITGGDRIRARRMRKDNFEFSPSHTTFVTTNYLPVIKGTDDGIWRRIIPVRFPVLISKDNQDPRLPERLKKEGAGILAWALAGTKRYLSSGLAIPRAIEEERAVYRKDSDSIGQFIEHRCVVEASAWESCGNLNRALSFWCKDEGIGEISSTALGRELSKRGFRDDRTKGKRVRRGIRLRRLTG